MKTKQIFGGIVPVLKIDKDRLLHIFSKDYMTITNLKLKTLFEIIRVRK